MEHRMVQLLEDALGENSEAMVPVQALYDLAGEEWLSAANLAAQRLGARVVRPEKASSFVLVSRRNRP